MLKLWDILVIVIHFLIIAGLGYFFSGRQKNTKEYFKGD